MDKLTLDTTLALEQQDKEIAQTVKSERKKLFSFIRKRVNDPQEAEDILQDVFYQLVQTYRLMKPVEEAAAWLFKVARNKITDRYRKQKPEIFSDKVVAGDEENETFFLSDILVADAKSAEEKMMNELLMDRIWEALEELPEEQKEVFVMHEMEDKSFREISDLTGESVNTLLSRKRYAILHLREALRDIYNEMFNS
ncbi:MAG: RNA polymerase sigma factor [Bacteroidota bacterium]